MYGPPPIKTLLGTDTNKATYTPAHFPLIQPKREHILKIETQYGIPCAWYQTDVHNMSTDIQNEFHMSSLKKSKSFARRHEWGISRTQISRHSSLQGLQYC